ncbi:MAG TPA: hypothetical protein VF078_06560 [Nitrospira sp.]
MKSMTRVVLSGVLSILAGVSLSYAQTTVPDRSPTAPDGSPTVDPETGRQVQSERAVVGEGVPPDRVVVKERVVERRHEGETYVAGFGGFTLGHSFSNVDGTGLIAGETLAGAESFDLANSVIYGMKAGYFLPTRKLNWLGFELESFNTTPHLEQQASTLGTIPGSHLRVTTVALNVIARKRMACSDRDRHDRTRRATVQDKDDRNYDKDGRYYDDDWSPEAENARCPLQVYAGAGPGIFFARTSNQTGSSSENGEVGVNALAGLKYFVHRNVSIFGEYKFNYAGFDFTEFATPAAGIRGNYKASHFIGGLAVHF